MTELVDTHAHLADSRLRARLDEVLASARSAGVGRMIAVATNALDSRVVVEIAREYPVVDATVGIHPNEAHAATLDDWMTVVELALDPAVVAIGETGLDRHWDQTPFSIQQDYFQRQLELSYRLGLPIIIHSRECHRDILAQLTALGRPVRGVAHSFTGTWDEAEELLALGLHISFAGMVTFANKSLDPVREAATRVPLDRLLVETDSPYLSPVPHRGKSNEPCRVIHTAAKVAELRGISQDDLAEATTANTRQLFQRLISD